MMAKATGSRLLLPRAAWMGGTTAPPTSSAPHQTTWFTMEGVDDGAVPPAVAVITTCLLYTSDAADDM
eukprot:1936920-Prorocentrum_lima.AAC.1